jgi:hypothetical protein
MNRLSALLLMLMSSAAIYFSRLSFRFPQWWFLLSGLNTFSN